MTSNSIRFSHQFNKQSIKLTAEKRGFKHKIFVYNGEETLIMIKLQDYQMISTTYLVGLPEFFKVEDMIYENQLTVASDYGIIIYNV